MRCCRASSWSARCCARKAKAPNTIVATRQAAAAIAVPRAHQGDRRGAEGRTGGGQLPGVRDPAQHPVAQVPRRWPVNGRAEQRRGLCQAAHLLPARVARVQVRLELVALVGRQSVEDVGADPRVDVVVVHQSTPRQSRSRVSRPAVASSPFPAAPGGARPLRDTCTRGSRRGAPSRAAGRSANRGTGAPARPASGPRPPRSPGRTTCPPGRHGSRAGRRPPPTVRGRRPCGARSSSPRRVRCRGSAWSGCLSSAPASTSSR